jgi:tetratricopeptide (TPR) repeat protein
MIFFGCSHKLPKTKIENSEMNIIEKYEYLVEEKKWDEALPVIREIIERDSGISTSWFNYGVCLDELGRYKEASEAFIKAQSIDIEDWGIHYRIFRSLYLAEDYDAFLEFALYSCGLNPEIIITLHDDEQFGTLFEKPEFVKLKKMYETYKEKD